MLKQSARKPSQDPNKESLLRKKDELKNNISAFNSKIKELKKDLHQFKKLMQTPLSKPIPENSAAYLGKLTSQFNEAANLFSQIPAKSNQIIQHQAALPKPLQAKASLIVTASSRVSRLLTRLKNLSSDDPESADRMSLLIICEELYYDLEKLQAYIVEFESSPQSIYSADALFNKLESNVKLIKGIVSRYESKEKKEEVSTLPTKKPLKDKVDEGKSELVKKCEEIIEKYLDNKSKYSESDREQVELLLFKFYGDYSEESAANLINKIKSLKPISQQEKLESTAQVGLKKWFGKARHSVSQYLSDKTSNFRLKIYNLAEEMRQELDEMMNSLESDMDASEISKKEKDLSEKLSRMKAEMLLLRSVLTGVSLSEDYVKMLRQKHLTDYDVELTSKQEEQIKNLMQSRRMRELANISNYRSTLRDKTIK